MGSKTNLIWDLSGTLFRPLSKGMTPEQLADYSFVFLMWSGKKIPSRLDAITYELLGLMGHQKETPDIIRDHTGKPVPLIICSYLAGSIDSTEAQEEALTFFDAWAPHNLTREDQKQVRMMISTFFDPHALATCMKPVEAAVKVLRKTAHLKENLYVLSNWDKDSFGPLYEKYKGTILSYFPRSNIVISADTGYVKPQRGIYEYLLKHHTLDPSSCFFIDDQEENVKAAQSCGIEAVQFKEDDTRSLESLLREKGLLP